MSGRTYHLSDLKANPKLMESLLASISLPEEKTENKKRKKKKIKKIKAVEEKPIVIEEGPIVVATPAETEEEKKVVVRHDDEEAVQKYLTVSKLVKEAEGFFNQRDVPFASLEVLFSTAYRYSDLKNRTLIVRARNLCKEAITVQEKKEKYKAQCKAKGKAPDRVKLKAYSTREIKTELSEIFNEMRVNLTTEERKREGRAYDNMHKQYSMDLSIHDNTAPIVLVRANIMVSVSKKIDLDALKRAKKHIEVTLIEEPIYVIKNALMVGCANYALPKVINEQSLEALMAINFQVKGNPIPKMLRHRTSNRVWFYVPEYSEIKINSLSFADRSMNSEFEAFRELTNSNITEDNIRFVFLQLGAEDARIQEIIKRWKASDSHQTRLAIITNEYQTVSRMQKSQRLRTMRENFLMENYDLIASTEKMIDRVQQISEEKTDIRHRFSILASHTGNADQGLPISRYGHLHTIFTQIERVRVRGNTSAYERQLTRRGIQNDKIECRVLYHTFVSLTKEARILSKRIAASKQETEAIRERAFTESN